MDVRPVLPVAAPKVCRKNAAQPNVGNMGRCKCLALNMGETLFALSCAASLVQNNVRLVYHKVRYPMGAVEIPRSTMERVVAECMAEAKAFPGNKEFVGYKVGVGVFDLLRLAGADVPSAEQLTKNYWQTTGPVIWAGTQPLDVPDELEAWFHEMTHAQQWWRDMLRMPVWYVQHAEMRGARYESEAYGQGLAVKAAITGEVPVAKEAVRSRYEHGYWLDQGSILVTTAILEGTLTSVARGIIPPGISRSGIRKLYRENPGYLDTGMLELIRKNNPEVLE